MTLITHTDSGKRITLPDECGVRAGDVLQMEVKDDGRVFLTPVVLVPRSKFLELVAAQSNSALIETTFKRKLQHPETGALLQEVDVPGKGLFCWDSDLATYLHAETKKAITHGDLLKLWPTSEP